MELAYAVVDKSYSHDGTAASTKYSSNPNKTDWEEGATVENKKQAVLEEMYTVVNKKQKISKEDILSIPPNTVEELCTVVIKGSTETPPIPPHTIDELYAAVKKKSKGSADQEDEEAPPIPPYTAATVDGH